jgi:hypothetical protein
MVHHAGLFLLWSIFMSSSVIRFVTGAAGRRYGRLALLASVLLIGVLCAPSKPGPNRCPHYPPPPPVDDFDPAIRIISPNGGEVFHVGDQCTVKVRSRYPVQSAVVYVDIGGISMTPPSSFPVLGAALPGDSSTGNSAVNAAIFTVSEYDSMRGGGNAYGVSDSCLITFTEYRPPYYSDTSDCYFSIKKP